MEDRTKVEECKFCKTRLLAKACLLPYELVKNYKRPNDNEEAIMAITQLHMQFGLEALQANANFTRQILTNEYFTTYSMTSAKSTQTDTEETSTQISTESVSDRAADKHQASQRGKDESKDTEKVKTTKSNPDKVKASKNKEGKPKTKPEPPQSFAKIANIFGRESTAITQQIESTSKDDEKTPTKGEMSKTQLPSAEELEHLTTEIASVLIYSFRSEKEYSNARAIMLIEALDKQLEIKARAGIRYIPSNQTELDHPSHLAKELVARHTTEEFTQWERGRPLTTHKQCVLNEPKLASNGNEAGTTRLIEELIRFSSKSLDEYELTPEYGQKVRSLLQSKLDARGYDIYNWFLTKRRRLQSQQPSRSENMEMKGKLSLIDYQKPNKHQKLTSEQETREHKCPPVEEGLLNFLNTQVRGIVETIIDEYEGRLPTLQEGRNLTSTLTHMTNEHIRHNSGWRNKTSMRSIDHLKKLEGYSQLTLKEESRDTILILLMRILTTIRLQETKDN